MPDIIKLLPDAVANQIAAGEVVQRPASAVKELLENAVDAGADDISLVIKDAGKTLIQVNDNGCGMTPMDARMSFERHATSKINNANDLFAIRTLGFRGEALASIAAIAQVEMKTRPKEEELGSCLKIEGSKLISQEPCQCKPGTSISVKNLFFNVPARRNFLKSNTTETRHIIDEFIRVALINPGIAFEMIHNDKPVYKLQKGSFKKRIIDLFGKVYQERLLPVEQKTNLLSISGFILKAEFSKKTRGEQYFFVNNRFIKNAYLNHAVTKAFSELLPTDAYPSYFLHITIDPADIDVNIHPTKTEINFKDARYVYSMVNAAVRESVGKFNLTPTLNFDEDPALTTAFHSRPEGEVRPPEIHVNPDYNPFDTKKSIPQGGPSAGFKPKTTGDKNWENLYRHFESKVDGIEEKPVSQQEMFSGQPEEKPMQEPGRFFQVHKRFILTNVRSGLMIIDQQKAHERILFEKYLEQLKDKRHPSQQLLFPKKVHLSPADRTLLADMKEELLNLGFTIEIKDDFTEVKGIPGELKENLIAGTLESIVENEKRESDKPATDRQTRLARLLAAQMAVKHGKTLTEPEMAELFDKLFACKVPDTAPDGKKIVGIADIHLLEEFLK